MPAPLGPMMPTMPPGGQPEVDVLEDHAVAVRFAEVRRLRSPYRPTAGRAGFGFPALPAGPRTARPPSFRRPGCGPCSWLAGPWPRRGPTPVRGRASSAGREACLLLDCQPRPASARARMSSCLRTDGPCRSRVPESTWRRCRGSSDRGSRRRRCPDTRRDAARARRRFRRRDGSSARRAAASRACSQQQLAQGDAALLAAGERS